MVTGVRSSTLTPKPATPGSAGRERSGIRNGGRGTDAGSGPRHAAVADGRAGSRAERRLAGLAWLVLVIAVVVAGLGAVGIARLQEDAAQRHEAILELWLERIGRKAA
jgi:hypothetical protein